MSPDQILNKTFPVLFDLPVPSADFTRPGGKDAIDYATDYWQRSILFLDILRQRGNQQAEMTSRPINAVLIYDYEIIMRGHPSGRRHGSARAGDAQFRGARSTAGISRTSSTASMASKTRSRLEEPAGTGSRRISKIRCSS